MSFILAYYVTTLTWTNYHWKEGTDVLHQNINISQTSSGFIPLDHEYLKKVSETYETTYIGAIGTIVNTICENREYTLLYQLRSEIVFYKDSGKNFH